MGIVLPSVGLYAVCTAQCARAQDASSHRQNLGGPLQWPKFMSVFHIIKVAYDCMVLSGTI